MIKKQAALLAVLTALILGCHKGYIALLSDGGQPLRVYPYRLEVFPPDDQEALRRGLTVKNEKELNRLLQDFLS